MPRNLRTIVLGTYSIDLQEVYRDFRAERFLLDAGPSTILHARLLKHYTLTYNARDAILAAYSTPDMQVPSGPRLYRFAATIVENIASYKDLSRPPAPVIQPGKPLQQASILELMALVRGRLIKQAMRDLHLQTDDQIIVRGNVALARGRGFIHRGLDAQNWPRKILWLFSESEEIEA